jgi:uncharacterized membrane protein
MAADDRVTATLGRCFFGAAVLASGVLQLATGTFVRLVPKLPAWLPAHSAWAYAAGVVLVVAGLAILSGRMVRTAASVVGLMILLKLVLLFPSHMFSNPLIDRPLLRGFMWTNPLKSLALAGGAALLAGRLGGEGRAPSALARAFARLEPLAAVFLAVFLAVCGMQHVVYRQFVDTLVPAWIPPGQRFWTYFTGVALMAGGVGILVPRAARLAATLSGVMILLWVPLVHVARAVAGPQHANETAGAFEALALSGVAFMVAATRAPRSGGG